MGYCGEKQATSATPTGVRFSSLPVPGLGFLNKMEVLGDQISEIPQSPGSCDPVLNPEGLWGTPPRSSRAGKATASPSLREENAGGRNFLAVLGPEGLHRH